MIIEKREFREILTKYVLPQQMQIGLYGYASYLETIENQCKHILQILAYLDANEEQDPCAPFVEWTLPANALRMLCTLKKKCDIPLIFWIKYDMNTQYTPKIYTTINGKFIGILRIPFYTSNKTRNGKIRHDFHYFNLFIFQYERSTFLTRF
jgi:hypothetical protein